MPHGVAENQSEQVRQISISELYPFQSHPFKVIDDESMQRTVESVAQHGKFLCFLDLVDQKKIAFNPAVELSYLTADQQRDFVPKFRQKCESIFARKFAWRTPTRQAAASPEAMNDTQNTPSLSQAQRIKKLSQEGAFSYDAVFDIMGEAKKGELDKVTIKNEVLQKYFPRSYTPRQMEETIIKLLEQWQKKRQRSQER